MPCIFEGLQYSEGSLVCANGRELVCRNDDWEENGELCEQPEGNSDAREASTSTPSESDRDPTS
ncbi:DUF1496 domain-containing protein [Pseudomonas caspiana]